MPGSVNRSLPAWVRLTGVVLVAFGLAAAEPVAAQPTTAADPYDVLIRNARVIDGTGSPWRRADVALRGDRVAAVGRLGDPPARRVIDAAGLYLAPGWIDTHSHAGPALATDSLAEAVPLLAQGITTVFVNPDGGGPTDLAAQRDALERAGPGVNVGLMVPHGSVRAAVLGHADRAPSAAELEAMRVLVRSGMEDGAFGLTSGLFYAPGSYASADEVTALARVASAYGGVYASHIRDEGDYSIGVLAAVDELIAVAREADLPGIVTHIKVLGPAVWGLSELLVERIERARAEGVEVWADQYPYTASATTLTGALVPRDALEGGREALLRRLDDPEQQTAILRGVAANLARRGGADRLAVRSFSPNPDFEGRTLAAIADTLGLSPEETVLTLLRAENAGLVSHVMQDDDVERFMRRPWVMTASDGGLTAPGRGVPHPRNYGTFPRKLKRYAVERGVLSLEEAVRGMTSLPAAVYGLPDRGVVRPGAVADLVVFDLDRLEDPATYTDPHRPARGMVYVFVNGIAAIDGGRPTGARAGRVLRRRAGR